jgi:serine/threonine-protein kinase
MARRKKQSDRLGPYELRGELGRGAMAVVWRGFDPTLEREVAIKEPVTPAGGDPATVAEMSERFVREGKAAAQLNHPGIVTIYGADIYDGRPAIVMELIGGRTLSQVIDDGRLSPSAAVAIIDQLLDAVSFAHSRGVVHRDIKPDNIFVTDDGRVKLADFGIAHVGTTSTMTQAGQVLGTPGYMAPEQVVGSPVDARADIFAIGVIAYELLAGTNPFGATEAAPPTTVLYRIVHETPPTPAQLDPTVPQWLAAVISRAMAKDPAARYQSAEEMRADLRAQSAPSPGAWSAGPVATGAGTAGRPNTTYWVVGGAVVVAALALAFVFAGGNGIAISGASGSVATEASAASTPTSAPSVAPVDLSSQATLNASSVLRSGSVYYGPENLIDSNRATCWTDGTHNYGIGQWVQFDFPSQVTVSSVRLIAGYDKFNVVDRWKANGRLARMELRFSDGSTLDWRVADVRSWQDFTLPTPKVTTSVRLIVEGAYHASGGTVHDAPDMAIGEFHVWGTD